MSGVLALISYRVYPSLMGGQKGVALFYHYLKQEMNVVLAVSNNNALSNESQAVTHPVFYTNKWIFLNYFRIGHLKKLVDEHHIEVLIAEHSYTGWLAWLVTKKTGIPFIIHSHNLEALRFKNMHRWWWKLYWKYEKWIHQKADFNFFISEADASYAIRQFHLDDAKCTTITYGVDAFTEIPNCEKKKFLDAIGVSGEHKILFFNGTLDYRPNLEAVQLLIREIAPRLRQKGQLFKILISGNRISETLKQQIKQQPNFVYTGYVPDVNLVYQSAQLFINPILNNTGVKTKVLEAIANHCSVVSTTSGAHGISKKACGSKLVTVADGDWDYFTESVATQLQLASVPTPDHFFEQYLWTHLARKAAVSINKTAQHASISS